jgi:hypothetical protein
MMAPTQYCPSCQEVMYAEEKYYPAGTEVVYVCRNRRCPTFVQSDYQYPEKLKKFIDNK